MSVCDVLLSRYGLHGAYWHDNFGQRMSHGCVNLPPSEAKWLYEWSRSHTGNCWPLSIPKGSPIPMRLYLIRHADPDYANGTITAAGHREPRPGRPDGWTPFDHIYCSHWGGPSTPPRIRWNASRSRRRPMIGCKNCGLSRPIPDEYYHQPHTVAWDVPGEIIRSLEPLPLRRPGRRRR